MGLAHARINHFLYTYSGFDGSWGCDQRGLTGLDRYDAIIFFDNNIEFQGDVTPLLRCASAGAEHVAVFLGHGVCNRNMESEAQTLNFFVLFMFLFSILNY